jgi:hypothetical protein
MESISVVQETFMLIATELQPLNNSRYKFPINSQHLAAHINTVHKFYCRSK